MSLQTLILWGVPYFLLYWSAIYFSNHTICLGIEQKQAFCLQFFLFKGTCNLVQTACNGQGTVFPWGLLQAYLQTSAENATKRKLKPQHVNAFKTRESTMRKPQKWVCFLTDVHQEQYLVQLQGWYDLSSSWGRWWNPGTPVTPCKFSPRKLTPPRITQA